MKLRNIGSFTSACSLFILIIVLFYFLKTKEMLNSNLEIFHKMQNDIKDIYSDTSYSCFAMPHNMIKDSVLWLFHQDNDAQITYISCYEDINNIATYKFKCDNVDLKFFDNIVQYAPYGKIIYKGDNIIEWKISTILPKKQYFHIKSHICLTLNSISLINNGERWWVEISDGQNLYKIDSNSNNIIDQKSFKIIKVMPKYIVIEVKTSYGIVQKKLELNQKINIPYVDLY